MRVVASAHDTSVTEVERHYSKFISEYSDGRCHRTRSRSVKAGSFSSGSGGGRSPPRLERFASKGSERGAGCKMALDIKSVMDGGVSGEEALG